MGKAVERQSQVRRDSTWARAIFWVSTSSASAAPRAVRGHGYTSDRQPKTVVCDIPGLVRGHWPSIQPQSPVSDTVRKCAASDSAARDSNSVAWLR